MLLYICTLYRLCMETKVDILLTKFNYLQSTYYTYTVFPTIADVCAF